MQRHFIPALLLAASLVGQMDDVKADGLSHGMHELLLQHLDDTEFADRLISAEEVIREIRRIEAANPLYLAYQRGFEVFEPGNGCDKCKEGYKGRVGIFQVMEVSEVMGRIIMEGGNAMQIADQAAKEGVIDLRRAGLNKVKEGVTSLDEVNRVTIE